MLGISPINFSLKILLVYNSAVVYPSCWYKVGFLQPAQEQLHDQAASGETSVSIHRSTCVILLQKPRGTDHGGMDSTR